MSVQSQVVRFLKQPAPHIALRPNIVRAAAPARARDISDPSDGPTSRKGRNHLGEKGAMPQCHCEKCWENGEKRSLKSKHHTEILGILGVIDDMKWGLFENSRFTSTFGYLDEENDEPSNLGGP